MAAADIEELFKESVQKTQRTIFKLELIRNMHSEICSLFSLIFALILAIMVLLMIKQIG